VSAGFDTHVDDDLAGMSVTPDGFAHMARSLQRLAERHCEGRLAFALEGGYDRPGVAASVEAVLRAVVDEGSPDVIDATQAGAEAVERARRVQAAFWRV
jgi:acetoin utilization deacetylase AcuC-like enzyme